MKHLEIKKEKKLDSSPLIENGLTAAQQVEKMRAMYSNMDHCADCFDDDEDDPEKQDYAAAAPQKILTEEEYSLLTPKLKERYFAQLFVDGFNNPLFHDKSN